MLKKGSKLYSILTGTCPKCHEEDMYIDKNPYHISKIYQMHEKCSNCHLQYKIEPSFFYGAMYVSYALTVALAILIFLIAIFIFKLNLVNSFIAIIIGLIVFIPITARLARNIYINLFIHYDKIYAKT
jgi:uncharacterized protein (DUF983 family)